MDDRETRLASLWFIIDEQWMAEKPGLQAFTHWFITDEQWNDRETRLASFHTLVYYR